METTAREFHRNASKILAAAERGERITVTKNGPVPHRTATGPSGAGRRNPAAPGSSRRRPRTPLAL
ncbi:type II toxin-antitoxin system Phd/YefM family antitoxin [Streptomyces fungicidicus]|uniref:type II toxin-antitoxin system Phd/YefM family antitoxin n=1 Tax=Streptomyces fungicidicus TaxID=68203 RepID=UPI003656A74D